MKSNISIVTVFSNAAGVTMVIMGNEPELNRKLTAKYFVDLDKAGHPPPYEVNFMFDAYRKAVDVSVWSRDHVFCTDVPPALSMSIPVASLDRKVWRDYWSVLNGLFPQEEGNLRDDAVQKAGKAEEKRRSLHNALSESLERRLEMGGLKISSGLQEGEEMLRKSFDCLPKD